MLFPLGMTLSLAALGGPPEGERWVRVHLPTHESRQEAVSTGAGFLEGGRGNWRHLAVTDEQAQRLDALGHRVEDLPLPPPDDVEGYPTPAEVESTLRALADAHPGIAQIVQLGRSEEGRPIWALRIRASGTPTLGWRILGDHHGDEPSSGVLALSVAEHILDRYGNDPEVTELVDADEIWIAPMVNPDGVIQRSRYNANGVDLNRNYSHEWSASEFRAGSGPFSEAEPRAIRAHGTWTALGAGLSLHSGETNIGWVWNHTATPTTDASLLEDMALVYSDECDMPGFWITNGAEWYPTQGDTNDWAYGRHGVLDFTVEVSLLKTPPADALPGIIDAHIPAVMAFLQWPHRASGTVVDAVTGLPVPATIETGDGRLTTGPDGRFGRPIPEAGLSARASTLQPPLSAMAVTGTSPRRTSVTTSASRGSSNRPSPERETTTGEGRMLVSDAGSRRISTGCPGRRLAS